MYFSQQKPVQHYNILNNILRTSAASRKTKHKTEQSDHSEEKLVNDRHGWKVSQNEQMQEFDLMKVKRKISKTVST